MRNGVLVLAGLVAAACGHDDRGLFGKTFDHGDASAEAGCETGNERCACYGNHSCNDGLVCASSLCVRLDRTDAGAGGHSTNLGAGGREPTMPPITARETGGRGAGGARNAGGAITDDGGPAPDGDTAAGGTAAGGTAAGGTKGSGGTGGVKSSGGAGGGPDRLAPVAIYIMLDRSISMTMPPPGQSLDSWTSSVNSISAFVNDPLSAGLDVGLAGFPAGANNTFDCATGNDCGMPIVPIAALPNNAQLIIDALGAQRPMGLALTPTECALRGMISHCLQFMSNSPTGEKCVAVLVTDGTPTQCDLDNNNLVSIIADGKSKGVDTYTLGLPGSDINILNGYAMAGGTGMAVDVSAGPQAFIAALNAIRSKVTTTKGP